jgi:hypothetical protein
MLAHTREARVRGLQMATARNDAYAIHIMVQRGRYTAGPRRYGVVYPLKLHPCRQPYVHGIA